MVSIDTVMIAIHLVIGAIWIGSVAFVTLSVLPLARDGSLERTALDSILAKVQSISRIGALLMLVTGSHLMGTTGYFDMDTLLGTNRGLAVLAMVLLWLALIVIIEVATRRIRSGIDANLIREPARDGLTWFYIATAIGILLFVDGALLTTGAV